MYEWQFNYNEIDQLSHLSKIKSQNVKSKEMVIFQKLMEIYAYYNMKDYRITFELIKGLEDQINSLTKGYIKTTYSTRLNELLSHSSVRVSCNPEQSQEYAQKNIEEGIADKYVGYAYYIKGLSKFYSSFDDSLQNYVQSLRVFEDMEYKQSMEPVEEAIEFLHAYWGREINYKCKTNEIFYLLKTGQAVGEDEITSITNKAFKCLFLGMVRKDTNLLLEATIEFVRSGDSYTAIIAKEELSKVGLNASFIDSLIKINDMK